VSYVPIVTQEQRIPACDSLHAAARFQAAQNLVKVFGWYDNEWGYTCRLTDLAVLVGTQL
jgi:glyceraldehyde 3-phosphate dehydrogenase